MAMTYTWKITSMKTIDVDNVKDFVVQTYWTKTGTDENGNIGEFVGATPFDTSTMDPSTIVPFDQLTEDVVLDWIKSVVVGTYEQHVNLQIEKQINSKKIVEKPLPWDENSQISVPPSTSSNL
jgi:hypothetical protein